MRHESLSVLQNADTGAAPFPPGALSQCTHLSYQLSAPRWSMRRRLIVDLAALKSAVGAPAHMGGQKCSVPWWHMWQRSDERPSTAVHTLFNSDARGIHYCTRCVPAHEAELRTCLFASCAAACPHAQS